MKLDFLITSKAFFGETEVGLHYKHRTSSCSTATTYWWTATVLLHRKPNIPSTLVFDCCYRATQTCSQRLVVRVCVCHESSRLWAAGLINVPHWTLKCKSGVYQYRTVAHSSVAGTQSERTDRYLAIDRTSTKAETCHLLFAPWCVSVCVCICVSVASSSDSAGEFFFFVSLCVCMCVRGCVVYFQNAFNRKVHLS